MHTATVRSDRDLIRVEPGAAPGRHLLAGLELCSARAIRLSRNFKYTEIDQLSGKAPCPLTRRQAGHDQRGDRDGRTLLYLAALATLAVSGPSAFSIDLAARRSGRRTPGT